MPAKALTKDLFPKGLAIHKAFINRTEERKTLKQRVLNGEHTWIAAPRRSGKTSLIEQLCVDLGRKSEGVDVHTCLLDLMLVRNISDLQEMLFFAASKLLCSLESSHKSLLGLSKRYFDSRVREVSIRGSGVSVSFTIDKPTASTINETLLKIENIAADHHIVFLLAVDEFQKISDLKDSNVIEGSIRNAVQKSRHVTYLFSGSHRSFLSSMFTGKSRPLYRLCTQFDLDRIEVSKYTRYLNKVAIMVWSKLPDDSIYQAIFDLSRRHPYYMNAVCRKLIAGDFPKNVNMINRIWEEVISEERHWLLNEFDNLPSSRAILLKMLACKPTDKPTSSEFSKESGLATSSISDNLGALLRDDMVYMEKDSAFYRVLDPGLEFILKGNR